MNWDDDWNNPYRKRSPYGKRGWWWSNDHKYNTWKKWETTPERKELNDMVKKAWEKIEQWIPEREPDLTPSWSDIEKLYKHCEKLYKHIAVLHDDVERLKKKVVLMNRQIVLPIIGKKKGLSEKGIDKEIKHLKSMGYNPSPTAFGRKPKKKRSKKK